MYGTLVWVEVAKRRKRWPRGTLSAKRNTNKHFNQLWYLTASPVTVMLKALLRVKGMPHSPGIFLAGRKLELGPNA